MRKLLKKFIRWVMEEKDDFNIKLKSKELSCMPEPSGLPHHRVGMSFHLYPASGGTVIEVRNRDHKTDELHTTLYVIPEGDDFTQTLGQIVSLERLKA